MLTKAQAKALAKWRDGKPENEIFLKVRDDVFCRLSNMGMLRTRSFLVRQITEEGQAALAEFEAKHGPIA
jgi:hypothetical protein